MKRNTSSISTIKRRLATGLARLAAVGAALFQPPAAAEDIDLFVQPPARTTARRTCSSSSTTRRTGIRRSPTKLRRSSTRSTAWRSTPTARAQFRVGLMMFTETGNPNNNIDGGYVRAAVRDLDDAANKTLYMNLLNSLHVNNDKSNGGKAGLTMMEAYYYFAGKNAPLREQQGQDGLHGQQLRHARRRRRSTRCPSNALSGAFAAQPYNSPVVDGQLRPELHHLHQQRRGAGQQLRQHDRDAGTALQAEGAATPPRSRSRPADRMTNMADEWARFMEQSPYGITTYTVDVNKVTTGQGPGWTALLKSMASVSSGKYFDVNSAGAGSQIADALEDAFSPRSRRSTACSPRSACRSASTPQGTYLNQIYIGMFRPDRMAAALGRQSQAVQARTS